MKNDNSVIKNVLIISASVVVATCYISAATLLAGHMGDSNNKKSAQDQTEQVTVELDGDLAQLIQEDIKKLQESEEAEEDKEKEASLVSGEIENNTVSEKESQHIQIETAQTVAKTDFPVTVVSDVTEVVKAAMPSVVAITNEYTSYDYWSEDAVQEQSNGSGIIVAQSESELLMVTNYHVIENSDNIFVKFIDDKEVQAYVKGIATDYDLAVISVFIDDIEKETLSEIAVAVLGESDSLQVGEPAIAIGNSLGYGQSVTTGVISAVNREIYPYDTGSKDELSVFIQTDAAINPGNSGGALLNVRGEVIGINSSKIADYVIEGMGYAIPITTAKPIIEDLLKKETKKKVPEDERAFLGIAGNDVSEEAMLDYAMPEGVYVVSVIEDSAAEKAGFLRGDIITALDGEKVSQMTAVQDILEFYSAGSEMTITIMRQDKGEYKEKEMKVILGNKEE